MIKVILPELGENIEKATVSYWYFQEGAKVKEKDELVEVTTDKATYNVPAPRAGVLAQILVKEGDSVNVGEPLAVIEEE